MKAVIVEHGSDAAKVTNVHEADRCARCFRCHQRRTVVGQEVILRGAQGSRR